jgi:peroxiredoxin
VSALRAGDFAPPFTLPGFAPLTGAPLGDHALRDLRGRPVVLIFLRWLG